MLTINNITVMANFTDFFLIRWYIDDTTESTANYVFNVYESLSPYTDYHLVASGITTYEYQYTNLSNLDSSVHMYFKVECVNTVTTQTVMSPLFGALYYVADDDFSYAINYMQNYLLQDILEIPPAKLLIRRRMGQRCSSCWDEELGEVTKSNCTVCYNTGYNGGYLPARDLQISFTEPGFMHKFDMGDVRDVQQNVTSAYTSNYPLILPMDILALDSNRRFRVLQCQPTTKGGRVYLRQLLQVQLIPPTDVVYKLDLSVTETILNFGDTVDVPATVSDHYESMSVSPLATILVFSEGSSITPTDSFTGTELSTELDENVSSPTDTMSKY